MSNRASSSKHLNRPVITLRPKVLYAHLQRVVLKHTFFDNNIQVQKRKATINKIWRGDPELILRTIMEFYDACDTTRFNPNTGMLHFTYFPQTMDESIKLTWQDVLSEIANRSLPAFEQAISNFIGRFIQDDAYVNLRTYLQTTKTQG